MTPTRWNLYRFRDAVQIADQEGPYQTKRSRCEAVAAKYNSINGGAGLNGQAMAYPDAYDVLRSPVFIAMMTEPAPPPKQAIKPEEPTTLEEAKLRYDSLLKRTARYRIALDQLLEHFQSRAVRERWTSRDKDWKQIHMLREALRFQAVEPIRHPTRSHFPKPKK